MHRFSRIHFTVAVLVYPSVDHDGIGLERTHNNNRKTLGPFDVNDKLFAFLNGRNRVIVPSLLEGRIGIEALKRVAGSNVGIIEIGLICTANNNLIFALLERFDVSEGHFNTARHNRHLKDIRLPLCVNVDRACGHCPLFGDYFTVTCPNTVKDVTGLLSRAHLEHVENGIEVGYLKGFIAVAIILIINVCPKLIALVSGINVFGINRVGIGGFGHVCGSREIVFFPNTGITRIGAIRSTRFIA